MRLTQIRLPAQRLQMVLAALALAALPGCSGSDSGAVTATASATIPNATKAAEATTTASGSGDAGTPDSNAADAGLVPVMPNLSEADVSEVTAAATSAYNKAWGDGSGVDVVWGPNIVSGWAIIGMENISGAAGKDVLLQKEGGAWVVRDMGNGLAAQWNDRTPAGLWP
ncbi:MAG: hypothetical protein AAB281_01720 [Actinomycetota bacterium]